MRNEDYQRDNSDEERTPSENRAGLWIGAGVIGLAAAVGFSIFVLNGLQNALDQPEDQALRDDEARALELALAPPETLPAAPEPELEPEPSPADQLREAQAQVENLQTELSARDAELASLKSQIADRDATDEAARQRYRERQAAIQHEIASLKEELKTAETERDELRNELKLVLAELDRQVERNQELRYTAVAFKEASSENLWFAFTNNTKVRICDRGSHMRRQSCERDIDAWFDEDQHEAFTTCVNTFQAIPMLWEAKGDTIPPLAKRIDARDRERKDEWYVVYCDPTLPEGAGPRDITEERPQIFAMADG